MLSDAPPLPRNRRLTAKHHRRHSRVLCPGSAGSDLAVADGATVNVLNVGSRKARADEKDFHSGLRVRTAQAQHQRAPDRNFAHSSAGGWLLPPIRAMNFLDGSTR